MSCPCAAVMGLEYTWRGRGLSKSFISRVIIGVSPFRVLITLLITYLLTPLPLQVGCHEGPLIFTTTVAVHDNVFVWLTAMYMMFSFLEDLVP